MTNDSFTKAELKATQDGFNNMPARVELEHAFASFGESAWFDYVDLKHTAHWQNGEDTVVVAINASETAFIRMLLARIAKHLDVDEFDFIKAGPQLVARFWWD
jgi:hypothetical protein